MKLSSHTVSSVLLLVLLGYSHAQRGDDRDPSDVAPPAELPNDADPATVDDPSRDGPIRAEPKPNTNVKPEAGGEAGSASDDRVVEINMDTSSGSSIVKVRMEEVEHFWGTEIKGRQRLQPGLEIYGFEILGGREEEFNCKAIKLLGETGLGDSSMAAGVPFGERLDQPRTDIDAIDCSLR